jgi:SAM-dependent methyltransferase
MKIQCPLCGFSDTELLGKRSQIASLECYAPYVAHLNDFDRHIMKCRICGFQFVDPMYGDREVAALYDQPGYEKFMTWVKSYFGLDHMTLEDLLIRSKNRLLAVGVDEWMRKYFSESRRQPRCLDVGCGDGFNMMVFRELGFDVFGMDLSEVQIEEARRRFGFTVRKIAVEQLDENETYDCVLAMHVVEHMACPHTFMSKLVKTINPNGILLLEPPLSIANYRKEHRHGDIYHTLFFDHFTLALLAATHGMELVESSDVIYPIDDFIHVDMLLCRRRSEEPFDSDMPCGLTRALRAAHDRLESGYLEYAREHLRVESETTSPVYHLGKLWKWFRRHGFITTLNRSVAYLRDDYLSRKR